MKYEKCESCTERAIPLLFIGNVFLAALKTVIGILGNSAGLVADGTHSATDAFSAAMLYFGIKFAEKPADKEHPFGHRNIEFVIAKVVSVFLLMVGIYIMASAIYHMVVGNLVKPDYITLACAILGIVTNGLMYRYGKCVAKQMNSIAVLTVAYEIKADAMTSIAIAIGIVCSELGYPLFDSIAACVVSVLIIKNSIQMLRNSMDGLMDHSISPKQKRKICSIVLRNKNVLNLEFVRARHVGRYLSFEIGVKIEGSKSIEEGNNIIRDIKGDLMKNFEHLKYVDINISSHEPKSEYVPKSEYEPKSEPEEIAEPTAELEVIGEPESLDTPESKDDGEVNEVVVE